MQRRAIETSKGSYNQIVNNNGNIYPNVVLLSLDNNTKVIKFE